MTVQADAERTVRFAFGQFLQLPGRKPATQKKFCDKFKLFLVKYGDKHLSEIDGSLLREWFVFLEEAKGYSKGHLAIHRSCHITFWGYCSQWLGGNPANSLPRYPQKPTRVIVARADDVELVLRVCDRMWATLVEQRDAAIFTLGTTGLRRSNIADLLYTEVADALRNPVELDGGLNVYLVAAHDGKEAMEAVLDERRASIVRRYVENRPVVPHNRLFVNLDPGSQHYLRPLTSAGYQHVRNRLCKRAGVGRISFQKMRRLVGTRVARASGVEVAAHVLGHRSGTKVVIDHYFDPDKEAARKAVLRSYSP